MSVAPQTHDPLVVNLIADRWREEPGYRVLRQRGSASWLLIVTEDGSGRFGHSEGLFHSRRGDAVLMQPRRLHEYGCAPNSAFWDFSWAHFHMRPHWESFLSWPALGPGMRHAFLEEEALETVSGLLRETVAQARKGQPLADAVAMNLLERVLLEIAQGITHRSSNILDERVARAIHHAQEHLREPVDIESLAEICSLSPSRFAHLFAKETGVSPRLFVERLKIDRARQLLELTDLTVRAVGQAVGFANEFYFSLRFKKLTGQSPSAFRGSVRG